MSAADFVLARNLMVDGQLRPTNVNDRRILDAMRTLPREAYLPPALADLAYMDDDIALGDGRAMLKPLVLARLVQLARPRVGETALVVGAGTGYGSALLAACGVQVTALEPSATLAAIARANPNPLVRFVEGPLARGAPAGAPYDLVMIEGAVREIPEAIGGQVSANGRLVAVLWPEGGASVGAIAEPSVGGLRARAAFDAGAPLLPGLQPAPRFAF